MWFEEEKLSGYERLRREQPRISTPLYAPRRFYGDITHMIYENCTGVIRLIQNNDYEECKRIYFIEVSLVDGETIRLRTESRTEAGELYEKHKSELMKNE